MPSKVHVTLRGKNIEVIASCVIFIESDATVALDASVHFMVNERTEILIFISSFFEVKPSVSMTRHHRHILEVA
jgi:hypothetical protein